MNRSMMQWIKEHRKIFITVMAVAVTAIVMSLFWVIKLSGTTVWQEQMIESSSALFTAKADGVSAIRFCNDDSSAVSELNQAVSVSVEIRDRSGRTIWDKTFDDVQISTNAYGDWIDLSGEHISLRKGETYELVTSVNQHVSRAVTIAFQTTERAPLFEMYLVLCLLILAIFGVISLWYLHFHGGHFRSFWAITVLMLGILCNLIMTPIGVPDEDFHLSEAYLLSDRMMGIGDGNSVVITESGISRVISDADIQSTIQFWSDWKYGNQKVQWNSNRFIRSEMIAGYENVVYLMPALGMTLMRLFHAPYQIILLTGRMMNLMLLLIVSLWIMKCYPEMKYAIAAIGLLPSTLWLAASFSYDTWNLAFSMAFVAYCCYCRERVQTMRLRNVLILMLLLIAFVPVKFVYIVTALAIFFIPRKSWSDKKMVAGCIAAAVMVMAALFIVRGQEVIATLTTSSMDTRGIDGATPDSYTIGWVLRHPFSTLLVFIHTAVQYTDRYVTKCVIGDFYDKYVPDFVTAVVIAIVLFLMMSAFRVKSESSEFRVGCILAFVVGALAVLAAFLFVYTNISTDGTGTIGGIQGRYFLPFLIFVPGMIHSDRFTQYMEDRLGAEFRNLLVMLLMTADLWVLFCKFSGIVQG